MNEHFLVQFAENDEEDILNILYWVYNKNVEFLEQSGCSYFGLTNTVT